jgi:uncharacterized membrane protein YGL010W
MALPFIVNPKLARYFRSYSEDHRTKGNQLCHTIGIPTIVISLFGILSHEIQVAGINGGLLLMGLAAVWYFYLDWKITIPFLAAACVTYWLGNQISTWNCIALFIIGWVFQLIGHYVYEKRSPSFLKNVEQLLIGPLWLFSKFVGYTRLRDAGASR